MKDVVISKAALARALDCSRGTITRLCGLGMPSREDGRLNRSEALRWITRSTSGVGGGWSGESRGKPGVQERAEALLRGKMARSRSRKPTSPPRAAEPEAERPSDYDLGWWAGRASIAHQLCRNMHTALAELLAGMEVNKSLPPEEALLQRVFPLALITHLMEAWLEDQLCDAKALGLKPLPPIAWKRLFGPEAKSARELFEELQQYWTGPAESPRSSVRAGQ
jgi:hypothetical protein